LHCFAKLDLQMPIYNRVYKRSVDIERILLAQESFNLTLLLYLEEAFETQHSELSAKIQQLYRICPKIFNSLLGLHEAALLKTEEDGENGENDDSTAVLRRFAGVSSEKCDTRDCERATRGSCNGRCLQVSTCRLKRTPASLARHHHRCHTILSTDQFGIAQYRKSCSEGGRDIWLPAGAASPQNMPDIMN